MENRWSKEFQEAYKKALEDAEKHPENYNDIFAGYENDLQKSLSLIEWQEDRIKWLEAQIEFTLRCVSNKDFPISNEAEYLLNSLGYRKMSERINKKNEEPVVIEEGYHLADKDPKNTFIYRPQRSTLDEAMAEKREFANLKQMLEYVVEEHENAFDLDNVFISYYGYDERISWDTYIVCVTRYGDEEYDHPQAIGFCAML